MRNILKRDLPVIHKRKGISDRIIFGVAFSIFAIYALSIIVYFGWAVLASFKTQKEFIYTPMALPTKLRFENYKDAIEIFVINETSFIGMMLNSLWYSLGAGFLYIFFHLCTSYVITRFNFKAKKFMYFMIVLYMLLPLYGSGASTYKLIKMLGLVNSPFYLITFMGGFTGSTFLILSAAWETIDGTYSEAAEIDGASQYRVYFSIMLPMVLGPAFALFIMQFIGHWNNYETFVMYLDELPNLAMGIYEFGNEMIYESNDPVFFAGVTMTMIPILVFFSIFSNKIMESVTFGTGIKG